MNLCIVVLFVHEGKYTSETNIIRVFVLHTRTTLVNSVI